MICMTVGINDGIDPFDPIAVDLINEIWSHVELQMFPLQFDMNGCACSVVLELTSVASRQTEQSHLYSGTPVDVPEPNTVILTCSP